MINGAHAVAIVQKRHRIIESGFVIRSRHHHRDKLDIVLLRRGRNAVLRLAGGTRFQTRGPLILLQQLIGAGQCKGTAPSGRIMGDILHPDRSIVKYFRIFCDQLS